MKRLLYLVCLALAAPAFAADPAPMPPAPPDPAPALMPSVTLPKAITVKSNHLARVEVAYVGDDVKWWTDDLNSNLDVFREYDPTTKAMVLRIGGEDGVYQLHAVAASVVNGKAALSPVAECVITFGAPTPKPPQPGPTPTPPTPTPPADPDPIGAPGLHVLMLYKEADLPTLPTDQRMILQGAAMRTYLDANCPTGADGRHDWRMWPDTAVVKDEDPLWQKAFAHPHASTPWLLVGNGKTGYSGPLPATESDAEALLGKYKGT